MSANLNDTALADMLDLDIICDNAYELAQENNDSFVLLRKNGFGASDSSILLGVNPWKKIPDLVKDKRTMYVTPEDRKIGELENVRRGNDLEDVNLKKFAKWADTSCYKPNAMYRSNDYPYLTVDFDGIIYLEPYYIPVEAKYVSLYALKYWVPGKSIATLIGGTQYTCAGADLKSHIEEAAALYGIPPYYYTQLQHQMLLCGAPFGYMSVIFEKGWEHRVFKVFRDDYAVQQLIEIGAATWKEVRA